MKCSIIAAAVIAAVVLIGCDGKNSEKTGSDTKELLLYCGAGIRPPADELVDAFFAKYASA